VWCSFGLVLTAAGCGFSKLSDLPDPPDAGTGTGSGDGLSLLSGDIEPHLGTGDAASFNGPGGVVVDQHGNVFVGDTYNAAVRKITPDGVVTTVVGGPGPDGSLAASPLGFPGALGVDSAENLYVLDGAVNKITPDGTVSTVATVEPITSDPPEFPNSFVGARGLTADSAGNVYVADALQQILIKFAPDGTPSVFAGVVRHSGHNDATGVSAHFNLPCGITADSAGNLYVADFLNSLVRKVTPQAVVTTIAGTAEMEADIDGDRLTARFDKPVGAAVDSFGNAYVTEPQHGILRAISPSGEVTTVAGAIDVGGSADGPGTNALFGNPVGITGDANGNIYIADRGNHTIRKYDSTGNVTTIAGVPGMPGSADSNGPGPRPRWTPAPAVDQAGNLYIADPNDHVVRKIAADGSSSIIAGTPGVIGNADGVGSAASFHSPSGVAVDGAGNLYVADTLNYTIRKISPDETVTTIAGIAGVSWTATGDTFNAISGIAIDPSGNLFVADGGNQSVKQIAPDGTITTLSAGLGFPAGMAVDSAGNLYFADMRNHVIYKRTQSGIAVLAGVEGASGTADGPNVDARFQFPFGVAVDGNFNVYVADGNGTIRKISATGGVSTIAGTVGSPGIQLGSRPQFQSPQTLAIRGDSLVIGDTHAVLLLPHAVQ
jgi:sugar lactone lactonase YvrE